MSEMVAKLFLLQFYLFGCVIVRLRKMLFAVAGLRPQNILLVFLASLENLKFRYEIVLQPSLYVLLSEKDKKLYVGYTENLKLRFEARQKERITSTKDRRPFQLIYSEVCLDRKDAMHREKYLKTSYGKAFLRSRLKSYFTGCKNS